MIFGKDRSQAQGALIETIGEDRWRAMCIVLRDTSTCCATGRRQRSDPQYPFHCPSAKDDQGAQYNVRRARARDELVSPHRGGCQTLGTTVFSGMIGVTLFGLIFTPVFYVITRRARPARAAAAERAGARAEPRASPAE